MEHLDVIGLLKAAQTLERNVTVALMYAGLRVPQFRLLDTLDGIGQATVTEISEKLNITRATASVLVNDLVREGIVETVENPADRRSFYIRLSVHGSNKLRVGRNDLAVLIEELSRKYPGEMIRILNVFAGKVTAG